MRDGPVSPVLPHMHARRTAHHGEAALAWQMRTSGLHERLGSELRGNVIIVPPDR